MTSDPRPQRHAWAPGKYMHKCQTCSTQFLGSSHARICADCAYALPEPLQTKATIMNLEFKEFPKIFRLSREVIITEKIDGTNASIFISEDGQFLVGSRTRWITPQDDNHGFARWAMENEQELRKLGPGHHFGEWWGSGIQRGYGLLKGDKRFSLFNIHRWSDDAVRPSCCHVVPLLGRGIFHTNMIEDCLDDLRTLGSKASPGFMKPEGVVVFHTQGNFGLKKTLEKDEEPKSLHKP